jgi:hypothetical protein
MSYRTLTGIALAAGLVSAVLAWHASSSQAQQPIKESDPKSGKFEFEVVESFDAHYLGDTPGHRGRNGGLENRRPRVALGDPVFRGTEKVGLLTEIVWNRTGGSLDLEFDPMPMVRVNVGDVVWVAIDGQKAAVEKP